MSAVLICSRVVTVCRNVWGRTAKGPAPTAIWSSAERNHEALRNGPTTNRKAKTIS